MLDQLTFNIPAVSGQATQVIKARNLSRLKDYRDQNRRGLDAAKWCHGDLALEPSIEIAAMAFRVPVRLVRDKLKTLRGNSARPPKPPVTIDSIWADANEDERAEFMARHLKDAWLAVEAATAVAAA